MSTTSSQPSLSDVLHCLDPSRSLHRIYNTLVTIRTCHSKGSDAVTRLRQHGGIEKLLSVLKDVSDNKCRDVALSILGNCCMDDKSRLRVLKSSGISTICNIIQTTQVESIRHRACRTLANLCENVACCDLIHDDHSDVIAAIVTNLTSTEDRDCKVTYCRAIRLLSDTDEHRDSVLQHRALRVVATLLQSDDEHLMQASMKTIAHFINNCSEEGTRQLVAAETVAKLVSVASQTSSLASSATTMLLNMASRAPHLRPYLGNAGALELFVRQLSDLSNPTADSFRMIDAICRCCRDANNRIVMREAGGLPVLVQLLNRDDLVRIHDHIISAVACFTYDDAGLTTLLGCGLVSTLIPHLYRSSAVEPMCDVIDFDVCESDLMADSDLLLGINQSSNPASALCEESNVEECSNVTGKIDDVVTIPENEASSEVVDKLTSANDLTVDVSEAGSSSSEKADSVPQYSINSPTYKAVSAWRMEADMDDAASERRSPRNIWEGARFFADSFSVCSPMSNHSGSSMGSPRRSDLPSNCSWASLSGSLSNCSSPTHLSPAASPAWSLDSTGCSVHSPLSMTSGINPLGSLSPSSSNDDFGIEFTADMPSCQLVMDEDSLQEADKGEIILYAVDDNDQQSGIGLEEDDLDIETFQQKRRDERKLSRLVDLATSMYESAASSKESCCDKKPLKRPSSTMLLRQKQKIPRLSADEVPEKCTPDDGKILKELSSKSASLVSGDQEGDDHDSVSTTTASHHHHHHHHHLIKNICKITQRHILDMLSHISHSPETVSHMLNIRLFCALLDYIRMASHPLPTASKILLTLSRSRHGFELATLRLFPVFVRRRLTVDWSSEHSKCSEVVKVKSSMQSVNKSPDKDANSSAEADVTTCVINGKVKAERDAVKLSDDCCDVNKVPSTTAAQRLNDADELCNEILANLSVLAASAFGHGALMHIILRGNESQRYRCTLALCFMTRGLEYKYLRKLKLVDMEMEILWKPQSPLFPAAVFAVSSLLQPLTLSRHFQALSTSSMTKSVGSMDTVFLLDDGSRVEACRQIMSESSDVFSAMLSGGFLEAQQSEIRIPHAGAEAFSLMIRWCHGESLASDTAFGNLLEMVKLCHRFHMAHGLHFRLFRLIVDCFDRDAKLSDGIASYSLYGNEVSRRDCVILFFTRDIVSLRQRCSALTHVIEGSFGQEFMLATSELLTEVIS